MYKTVTAAIIQRNNTVLLCRRGPGQSMAGYWEFPGGKLESDESLKECLERELFEELNVRSVASSDIFCKVNHKYESGEIELIAMKVLLKDELISSNVHDKITWAAIEDLLKFRLAPADIPIAQKLMDFSNE
jgi:8-oxo-dGTP diphosphatase